MAGKRKSGSSDGESSPEAVERLEKAFYELDFNLVRLETYFTWESRYYTVVSRAIVFVSLIAGTSALAVALRIYPWVSIPLNLITTGLTISAYVFDLREMARFYTEKKALYSGWRSELPKHEYDEAWITNTTQAIREDGAASSKTYTVHYAVEALAWNDAYFKTWGPQNVPPADLYDVWWWERAVKHVIPFTRERFANRKTAPNRFPKPVRIASSVTLLTAGVILALSAAFLIYLALAYEFTATYEWTFRVGAGVIFVAAFLLVDAGFHKTRRLLERAPNNARQAPS